MARKNASTEAKAALGGAPSFDVGTSLMRAWDINSRINAYLLENVVDSAWRAEPPGGKGRTIAAIAAHMHNVRVMWLKMVKADVVPDQLDRTTVTPRQAVAALAQSTKALASVLGRAAAADGRVRGFRPDVMAFFGYLVAHDAHHRGQIATQARQAGFPLAKEVTFGMWEWGKR